VLSEWRARVLGGLRVGVIDKSGRAEEAFTDSESGCCHRPSSGSSPRTSIVQPQKIKSVRENAKFVTEISAGTAASAALGGRRRTGL
jgi:hypothetical protein